MADREWTFICPVVLHAGAKNGDKRACEEAERIW